MKVIRIKQIQQLIFQIIILCFDDIFFPLPQTQILNEFEKIVESIYNQVGLCQKQNVDFTHLRDSLLPMLMNGQVTVE